MERGKGLRRIGIVCLVVGLGVVVVGCIVEGTKQGWLDAIPYAAFIIVTSGAAIYIGRIK